MSPDVEDRIGKAAAELHLNPQVERAARHGLDALLAAAYAYRPAPMRHLSAEEHSTSLNPQAVVAAFTHAALSLSGQYARAGGYLLHTLDNWAPKPGT